MIGQSKYLFNKKLRRTAAALCALIMAFSSLPALAEKTPEQGIRINEVMSSNGGAVALSNGTLPDWVEIENFSQQPINLTGWALTASGDVTKPYVFPRITLQPGEMYIVYCDGDLKAGKDHADFKIAASGENITLMDKRGLTTDYVYLPELKKNQTYARDASGAWQVTELATPNAVNQIVSAEENGEASETDITDRINVVPADIVISEVMSKCVTWFADENGENHDYIELYNKGDKAINLAGWYLSDTGEQILRWEFPKVSIPAHGYLAVHCSAYDRREGKNLHTNFKLSSKGDTVILTRPDGVTCDLVTVPALTTDQAYSLTGTGWTTQMSPTPGQANTLEGAMMLSDGILKQSGSVFEITELMASSSKTNDWVEFRNTSSQAINVSGWGLSDNPNKPRKWQFPEGTYIPAGTYFGVVLSGLDGESNGALHANFRISKDGGYSMTLSDPSGKIMDRIYVPQQYQNVSYGRMDGQPGLRYFTTYTPGQPNSGTTYLGRASAPNYSVKGGLFKTGDTVTVELSGNPGDRIYYTLDCTTPTGNSTPYTGPITMTATTILRTKVYADNYMESYADCQSYLFDVNNGDGTIFVASMVSDPDNLFSDEKGIMVKGPNATDKFPFGSMNHGANFWMDWEREGHIELIAGTPEENQQLISQECGIKLHGQYSRASEQQSFKIIARGEYGDSRFHYPIFSERPYTEYQSFLLRSSGQDFKYTRMRDSVLTALAHDTSVMYQETEVAILYIDGKYWGHYYLRERINPYSVCQFENWTGMEDDIDLIKANNKEMQGSNDTFQKMIDYLKSHKANTEETYNVIDSTIDLQNYIEYMAIEMYTGNGDTLNVKRYRNSKTDGKWRWILFDLDWAFFVDTNSVTRWLDPTGMGTNKYTDTTLFIACINNAKIREMFLSHLGQQMATTFSSENVLAMIEERYYVLKPILKDHFERWEKVETLQRFNTELKKLVNYNNERPMRMLQFLKYSKPLGLSRNEMEKYFGDCMAQVGVTYDQIKDS